MKRLTGSLLVLAFAGLILLPVTTIFKTASSNHIHVADGSNGPNPPWPPCVFGPSAYGVAA
jgi:hypothetical protein